MKPSETTWFEHRVRNLEFQTDPCRDEQVLQRVLDTYRRNVRKPETRQRRFMGETIMRSKITRPAIAAAIVAAVVLGLNIAGGPHMATVALADVAKRMEQTTNCVFKKTTTVSSEDGVANAFDSLVYYTHNAAREDVRDGEKIVSQVYATFPDGVLVAVDHRNRVFRTMNLADEDAERLSPISPANLVDLILSKGAYRNLGRRTVDGVLSEGFEFDDERAMLSMDKDKIESIVMRLWVDVSTHLPVRAEVDCLLTDNAKARIVMYDPQWDVELASDFFEPKIPAGYAEPKQRGLLGIDLEKWPALKVAPGMAAEKAGVRSGDVVLKVNGNSVSHIESSGDALSLLSGKVGEKVALTVKRGEQILTFEVERAPAPE